jgi:tetratricopeptide (TPR) repeat protein
MKLNKFLLFALIPLLFFSCKQQNNNNNSPDVADPGKSMISLISEKIEKDSTNAFLYNERARLYLESNNINKALSDINKAIQINGKEPEFYISLADIYLKMGSGKKCEDALIKAMEIDPASIDPLLKLGEINFILQDYKDAIQYTNKAIEVDPDNPTAYLIKGYSYLEGGDTIRAIENFRTSYNNDQNNYDAVIQLALIFSKNNQPIAVDYFNNALLIKPESIEAWYGLGMFYQNNYDVENALAVYDSIIAFAPELKNAYYNKAYINMVMLEDFEEAVNLFTKAIEIDPEYTQAYYNRGFCFEKLKMFNEAVINYKKSLELETNYQIAIEALNRLADKNEAGTEKGI